MIPATTKLLCVQFVSGIGTQHPIGAGREEIAPRILFQFMSSSQACVTDIDVNSTADPCRVIFIVVP